MSRPIPRRPHPKHDRIAALLRRGLTNAEISKRLKCDKDAVARIRGQLGIVRNTPAKNVVEKWSEAAVPIEDGHAVWTGGFNNGTPVVRHEGRDHSARGLAFTMRTGRPPQGNVLADCELRECVAPEHMLDAVERTEIREQVRYLRGLPVRRDVCQAGHDQAVYGRYEATGIAYCSACNTTTKAASTARRRRERG